MEGDRRRREGRGGEIVGKSRKRRRWKGRRGRGGEIEGKIE